MTDREFVTALSNSVVDNVARKYSSQPQYHEGWKNRYKNELKDCLVYIAEDEAAAATPVEPDPEPEPEPAPRPNRVPAAPAGPAGPTVETDSDTDNGGETGAPSTGAGNNGAGNGGTASGGTGSAGGAGDSGSGSTGGSVSGSTDNGSSNGSTDVGEDSGTDSDSTEGSDTDNSSTENKPSVGKQLGSKLGYSLTSGINTGSSSDEGASGEAPESRTAGDALTDESAKQAETGPKKDDDKNVTSTTTTTKASGGNMPKTGDLIVMASLASASLATLGATSIVSGKHKLDQQNKAAGEDGSEE